MKIAPKERVSAWAPAVVWAAVIFFFSTDEFSAAQTKSWIEPLVRYFLPSLPQPAFEVFHGAVRKLAHVAEYFVFALLIDHGFRRGSTLSPAHAPLAAFAAAALYSLTDEAHQSLVSRRATIFDCGFDALGAALGALRARRKAYLG